MTTRDPNPPGDRRVPHFFEDYLRAVVREVDPQECTGCHRRVGGRWSDGTNVYCEPCMRYQHGYDQAEETLVRSIIGAAIAAALNTAPQALVFAALDDAIAARVRVEVD